jgi:hypothetical protein
MRIFFVFSSLFLVITKKLHLNSFFRRLLLSVVKILMLIPAVYRPIRIFFVANGSKQLSVMAIIFSGSGSYLDLNFGSGFESGSGLFMKNTLEIQMI